MSDTLTVCRSQNWMWNISVITLTTHF